MFDPNKFYDGQPWYMAGTEGTGQYTVRAASSRGRVGVRQFDAHVRIRLEPNPKLGAKVLAKWEKALPREVGYKHPGDDNENRFSIVVETGDYADAILDQIFPLLGHKADGKGALKSFTFNPDLTEPTKTKKLDAA
jgi:hypothetical protein